MVKRKLQEEDALPPDDLEAWASHPRLLRHVRCLVASKDPLLASGLEMVHFYPLVMTVAAFGWKNGHRNS